MAQRRPLVWSDWLTQFRTSVGWSAVGWADEARWLRWLTFFWLFVGFLILLIAVINFVNLSTAVYLDRTKEVAVRKALFELCGQRYF